MKVFDLASAKSAAATAAKIPGDRAEAIVAALASTVPARLSSKSAALAELRVRHTDAWEAHREAIALHMADTSNESRKAVADTKAAMDALAGPIAQARADLRQERERFAPDFHRQVKSLYPPIIERLIAARDLIAEAQAELSAIDAAANQIGMTVPNRDGGLPSLPLLNALIEGLSDDPSAR